MIKRTTKLRWRRLFRKRRRQVEDIGVQTEENIEKLFFRRLSRLGGVRRFVFSWVLLLALLIGGVVAQTRALTDLYQETAPVAGGTYSEGILGAFTNANPLYAASSVDNAVSRLLFSGLMRYNAQNRLVTDLAAEISVNEVGDVYTLKLRSDIFWHDGEPITSEDILYTYRTIQNPDAKSPLFTSWKGIKLKAIDDRTVTFTLPNALTSFPHSLTNGLVPKHKLEGIDPSHLRSARFNTVNPIGSGPFKWGTIEVTGTNPNNREEQIGLMPNERFHRGEPKLQRFIIRTFREEQQMIAAYEDQELNGMAGLGSLPDTSGDVRIVDHNVPLTGEVAVFFKTSQEHLKDKKLRQALVHAIDRTHIVKGLGYPVIPARGPLLQNHVGYDKELRQLPLNIKKANKLLDDAGWKMAEDGIRYKNKNPLEFRLYSQSTSEYAFVTYELQKQWRQIGVDLQVTLQTPSEIQTTVAQHSYDILLYGISLGVDPDVFPYWHSSQASSSSGSWLNFSEYKSEQADESLESGRTRDGNKLRAVKYQPFLEAWREDAPAIALYQPRFLYVSRSNIANFKPKTFNSAADRYANIENWMIREGKTLRQ